MPYRIPPVKVLSQSITEVIKEKGMVISQRRFSELVLKKLKDKDPEFSASEERIRRTAIFRNLARIQINYRETKDEARNGKCPVCGSETKEIHNQTLLGEDVKLGFKCVRCPYWTGPNRRVPVRYTFLSLQEGVIEPAPKKRKRAEEDDRFSQWKFA
ncbi:MAG: hypothetical protein A4E32_00783 [Methanomassiliicoccales archaeon PtaU1.Bin124]|nr:MAG: hypothetical protein A4E32_00783 [Methanomassiliicoccales archaeon PtaU1.Bin124]